MPEVNHSEYESLLGHQIKRTTLRNKIFGSTYVHQISSKNMSALY